MAIYGYPDSWSDCSNPCGGGSVDLSEYVKKDKIKDFDGVELLADDTKLEGVIYIKDDGSLWTYDGTDYVAVNHAHNVKVGRVDYTQNIPPSLAELNNMSYEKGTIGSIYLQDGTIELWAYNGSSWNKVYTQVRPTQRAFYNDHINNVDTVQESKFRYPPIQGDEAIVTLESDSGTMDSIAIHSKGSSGWNKISHLRSRGDYEDVLSLTSSGTLRKPNSLAVTTGNTAIITIDTTTWDKGDSLTVLNRGSKDVVVKVGGTTIDTIPISGKGKFYYNGSSLKDENIPVSNSRIDFKTANSSKLFEKVITSLLWNGAGCTSALGDATSFNIRNVTDNRTTETAAGGINGRCMSIGYGKQHLIQGGGFPITGNSSHMISFWVRMHTGNYILGDTNNSGGTNNALHVGWRDNNQFTIALFGNDVNFYKPDRETKGSTAGVWTHFVTQMELSNRKCKLYVNGTYAGVRTFPMNIGSSGTARLQQVGGSRNNADVAMQISNLRWCRESGSTWIYADDEIYKLYEVEKKFLVE